MGEKISEKQEKNLKEAKLLLLRGIKEVEKALHSKAAKLEFNIEAVSTRVHEQMRQESVRLKGEINSTNKSLDEFKF